MAWRDSRTQRRRLVVFALSIVSGIAALVAIHALKSSVEGGITTQAKALLGSDLQITSRQPFTPEVEAQITGRAANVSRETSFSSMLTFLKADSTRLVQVRALEGAYPFYGRVETSPPAAWHALRVQSGILLEPAMLEQFRAQVGDKVRLGDLELPILGVLNKPPPRSSRFSGFAPEAYIQRADLARTGLVGKTSLMFHTLHLELAGAQTAAAISKANADSSWRFETPESRRDTLGDSLDNFQQFLGMIALASLVLGAIGVAGAIHAHISRRASTIAILRCLGCPGDVAFAIYLAQALTLGLAGAVLGALLGVGIQAGTIAFFRESLPIAIDAMPPWLIVFRTTAAGFAVCAGFALLPLLAIRDISPATTLRAISPVGVGFRRAWPIYLLLAALLTGLAILNSSSWLRALALTGCLGVAFLFLVGIARGFVALTRRIVRPSWPYLLRQGISNLHRPHNQTLLFLLSLGLGTFLLLTILLTRDVLLARINIASTGDSPNIYLLDVQPDQVEGVAALLTTMRLPLLESAPIVTMRIQSVKGVPVRELKEQSTVPKWILDREYRSSYRTGFNRTESLTAGSWSGQTASADAPAPLSLEAELARDLRVTVGDSLVLDVQGSPVEAKITSLRKVDWSRFNLNFFMLFPPGILEAAPGFHLITTRVPEHASSGQLQRALVEQFPNVSAIDLTLILDQLRSILDRISRVIQILAGFTVLAGLAILIGTLLNGRDARLRESVLLRTLGASSRQIRTILLVEYAALGALSALSGLVLAVAANAALAIFVFKASPRPDPLLLAGTLCATIALSVAAGLSLSRGISQAPPLGILRSQATPGS